MADDQEEAEEAEDVELEEANAADLEDISREDPPEILEPEDFIIDIWIDL